MNRQKVPLPVGWAMMALLALQPASAQEAAEDDRHAGSTAVNVAGLQLSSNRQRFSVRLLNQHDRGSQLADTAWEQMTCAA